MQALAVRFDGVEEAGFACSRSTSLVRFKMQSQGWGKSKTLNKSSVKWQNTRDR